MLNITWNDALTVLSLSTRSFNCLDKAGIKTINDLLTYTATNNINNIPNMGKKSVEEVKKWIQIIEKQFNEVSVDNNIKKKLIRTSEFSLKQKNSGIIINDILVEDLNIPIRAKNSLRRSNILYVSELANKNLSDLLILKNMGNKTANIVLLEVNKILSDYILINNSDIKNVPKTPENLKLIDELINFFGQTKEFWEDKITDINKQYPTVRGESLIYCLYKQSATRNALKNFIMNLLEKNENKISKHLLDNKLPQHLYNTTLAEEILIEMEMDNSIDIIGMSIIRKYPSIHDFLKQVTDERTKEFLFYKLNGYTLAEIGKKFGVTRERVRQIINKALKRRPQLREDKYLYLYNNYNFTEEDFLLAFDESIEVYNYLEIVSVNSKNLRKPLDEELLTDNNIPIEFRKLAERAIYKKFVFLDGSYVKKSRSDLAKYVIKKYCTEITKFDDFIELYKIQLEDLGLQDNASLHIESRTYENKLLASDHVLWNFGRSFRYYNIKEKDFSDLFTAIVLNEYDNIEISTLKFFRDYPDLMQQYDIRDEYELHNLLKKVYPNEKNKIIFNRMPTIEIGKVDRDEQVLELLLQYAPISAEDLANKYEETYGIKASTVLANYLANFDTYYYNGIYSISSDNLPLIQYERMKEVLIEPFYLITEIRDIFLLEFPEARADSINPYVLKTLGFRVYSGYVINKEYDNANDYFKEILTANEIVDARKFKSQLQSIVNYSSILYKLRSEYEIIEFLPLQYINIKRLNKIGVSKLDLEKYTEEVGNIYKIGDFFTIYSLRRKGFAHELDNLGFDEWFYSSLLLENKELFSYQRVGGNRLFLRGKGNAQMSNMLKWILEKQIKIDLYDLLDLLKNDYNIIIPKEKILEMIKGTDLYYDTIMEIVYIDYDTYFEEI